MKHAGSLTTLPKRNLNAEDGIEAGKDGSKDLTSESSGSPKRKSPQNYLMKDVQVSPLLLKLCNMGTNSYSFLEIEKLTEEQIESIEKEIEEIKRKDNWKPIGLKGAAVYLERLAATFQVSIPDKIGLEAYLDIMKDMPAGPAKRGLRHIMATHKYKTLPIPSEILSATYTDKLYWQIDAATRRIRIAKQRRTPCP